MLRTILRTSFVVTIFACLSSCVIPVPVPKERNVPIARFMPHSAFYKDGMLTLVAKSKEHQISLPLSELASVPFDTSYTNTYMVNLQTEIEPLAEDFDVEKLDAVRLYVNCRSLQFYTIGFDFRQDLNLHGYIPDDIELRQVADNETMAIFPLPKTLGWNLWLLRSRNLLPNGSHSAVFELKEVWAKKTGVALPVVYPDMWGGGWRVGTTR